LRKRGTSRNKASLNRECFAHIICLQQVHQSGGEVGRMGPFITAAVQLKYNFKKGKK